MPLTANVTSLEFPWGALAAAAWGLHAVQEARLRWSAGWPAPPVRTSSWGDPVADGTALVADIARAGRVARRETPLGTNGTECLHLVSRLPGGGMVRVYSVYLPPGPVEEQRACDTVQACMVDAQRTPGVPAVIVGDMNAELRDQQLEAVLWRWGWADPPPDVATSTSAAVPRRIDWLLGTSGSHGVCRGANMDPRLRGGKHSDGSQRCEIQRKGVVCLARVRLIAVLGGAAPSARIQRMCENV